MWTSGLGLPVLAVKWWSKDTNRLTAKKDNAQWLPSFIHSQLPDNIDQCISRCWAVCMRMFPLNKNPVFLKDFASSCPQFEANQHPSHCYLNMNDHHPPLKATLFQNMGATSGPH